MALLYDIESKYVLKAYQLYLFNLLEKKVTCQIINEIRVHTSFKRQDSYHVKPWNNFNVYRRYKFCKLREW